MCFGTSQPPKNGANAEPNKIPYHVSRLNDSTHLIVHNDSYYEYPFIYIKLYPSLPLAVIIDTGCGAKPSKEGSPAQEIKDFIQSAILQDNPPTPDHDAEYNFLVVCTHCHFDHIGGIQAFSTAGATILASAHDTAFLTPETRDAHSLCSAFGLALPHYTISTFLQDNERLHHNGHDLGLRALHTPGHTPDSMALYDERERWLFVGDTCYPRAATLPWGEQVSVPIILPVQGDWEAFQHSVRRMREFVQREEAQLGDGVTIRLAAGHTTANAQANEFLDETQAFVDRLNRAQVPILMFCPNGEVAPGGSLGPETFIFFQDEGEPMFSFIAPERLLGDISGRCRVR